MSKHHEHPQSNWRGKVALDTQVGAGENEISTMEECHSEGSVVGCIKKKSKQYNESFPGRWDLSLRAFHFSPLIMNKILNKPDRRNESDVDPFPSCASGSPAKRWVTPNGCKTYDWVTEESQIGESKESLQVHGCRSYDWVTGRITSCICSSMFHLLPQLNFWKF